MKKKLSQNFSFFKKILYVIPSALLSFLPYYRHSFRITVIPSGLLSFLPFCINLEVVIFQGRNPTFIFLENPFHHKLLSRFTDLYIAHFHSLLPSLTRFSALSLVSVGGNTVATEELLCLKNAVTQISMFFTSNE